MIEASTEQENIQSPASPAPSRDASLPCRGQLKRLLNCQTVRVVPAQHLIYSQGEYPHSACLICSGLVKLTRTEPDGNRVIVGLRQKGWMMGAASLILNARFETSAETITASKLCFISGDRLVREINSNLELSRWVLVMFSEGLRASMVNISERSCLSGRQRLLDFLWKLLEASNGFDPKKPAKIQMILKHWEVAQLLALTPQYLCRLVKQLEKERIVSRKNGWLVLHDPESLRPTETGRSVFGSQR